MSFILSDDVSKMNSYYSTTMPIARHIAETYSSQLYADTYSPQINRMLLNGLQLAKMKKSIPDMSLP